MDGNDGTFDTEAMEIGNLNNPPKAGDLAAVFENIRRQILMDTSEDGSPQEAVSLANKGLQRIAKSSRKSKKNIIIHKCL